MIRPGQHGAKGRRKLSDFGVQLKEKQKVKYIYGVLEKQLRKAYEQASKSETATGATMLSLLERRLDNVVYRLNWAPTRAAARQLVSHAHVKVNGQRMDVPSYLVKVGDVISLNDKAVKIPFVVQLLKDEPKSSVEWLEKKRAVAKVARLPMREDIKENIDEQLVVEHYSR
jgi:small subunit ribosomal protein S4